jgi:hypothetical protein
MGVARAASQPPRTHRQHPAGAQHSLAKGPVWFSFFLTSFSENLTVGRIWLWGESEYDYDYV